MQDTSKLILTYGCGYLTRILKTKGLNPQVAGSLTELNFTRTRQPRIIVIRSTAIRQKSTEEVVANIKHYWPLTDVLVWAPRSSGELVQAVFKAGAHDVILTESLEDVANTVVSTLSEQKIFPRASPKSAPYGVYRFHSLLSRSQKMQDIFEISHKIAGSSAAVLILGETGTGKELLARGIHKESARPGHFVAINCAAIPESLVNSELFGHVKGAFTGAISDKKGLFRYAENGTILLDEIGNMPLSTQYYLLRVLQEGTVRPVGGHEEIPVTARVIAATSTPLDQSLKDGSFREDLLYRLDVVRIIIPPLRERPEDIAFLFHHFSKSLARQYHLGKIDFRDDFLDAMLNYGWPGNVRQLENLTERLLLTHINTKLTANHFARLLTPFTKSPKPDVHISPKNSFELKLNLNLTLAEAMKPIVRKLERGYLESLLKANNGRINKSAETAGIDRRTFLRKMNQYGIDKKQYKNIETEP